MMALDPREQEGWIRTEKGSQKTGKKKKLEKKGIK